MCPRSPWGLRVVVGGVRPLWLFDEFDGLDHGSLFSVSCEVTLCFFHQETVLEFAVK